MAVDTTRYQGFSYIRDNGIDKYLIEEYLLPGLLSQSRLGKKSRGIPLPTPFGKSQEYFSLDDASEAVLEWLENHNQLYEKDKSKLLSLLKKIKARTGKFGEVIKEISGDSQVAGYEQFANITSEIYQTRVQDPNKLFTSARLQNLAVYRAAQKARAPAITSKFDPGKAIDDYNTLYTKLLNYANIGASPALFQSILPAGVPSGSGDLSKQILAQIIMQNISELRGAAKAYQGDDVGAAHSVSRKLEEVIVNSYPEQAVYLNLLGDKELSQNLNHFVESVEANLTKDKIKLSDVEDAKYLALAAVDDVIETESEIYARIDSILSLSTSEKKIFAKALIQSINSSSGKQLTGGEIIRLAGEKINADLTQLEHIRGELEKSGLSVAIEYRQNELAIKVGSNYLTNGERQLLKRGINPFQIQKSEADLTIEKSKLLNEFQVDSGTKFTNVLEAHEFELRRDSPDLNWTRRFRAHLDQTGSYSYLDNVEKSLVNRTRFGRKITEWRSRVYGLQDKFFTKWIDLEETLTGRKFLNTLLDKWDIIAETIYIPGTKIPFFRIVPWLYDRIYEWKKVTTVNALARTSGWTNPIGKFINQSIKYYQLGGHTVNGASYEAFRTAWGSGTKWVLEQSTTIATKLGGGSAFKYVSISAGRTATRLLLQLGGKALVRFGEKAIGALVAAGTAIGSAFSVVLGILMVWDLIKLAGKVIGEFFRNGKFRKTVMGWGLAIGALFAGNFGTIGLAIGVMFAGALQILLLSVLIVGISLVSTSIIQNNIKNTFNLDSGSALQQAVVNVICNAVGSEPQDQPTGDRASTANSMVSAGQCIYDFLTKFNINPLTSKNANGPAWGNFVKALGNAEASYIIQASANGQKYFQCSGYIAGVGAMGGKPFHPINACSYVNNPPKGYKWTTTPTVGCFFVIGSPSCSDSEPGHVGLVSCVKGGIICAMDANFSATHWGIVRVNGEFPTSKIAGYMCP